MAGLPRSSQGIDKCSECLRAAPIPAALGVADRRIVGIETKDSREFLACEEACPTGAIRAWCKRVTVGEVMEEVLADREFYEESGGGLTLSGGEALVQHEFAVELLKAARAEGIHTCVETALNVRISALDAALPFVDLALCDLKHMDSAAHKRFTGAGNCRILRNLDKVAASVTPIVVRIPVVPDHNGTEDNLRATACYIAEEHDGRVIQVQLLPYRKLGLERYRFLGMAYPMQDFEAPPREQWENDIRGFAEMMRSYGVYTVAGASHRIEA